MSKRDIQLEKSEMRGGLTYTVYDCMCCFKHSSLNINWIGKLWITSCKNLKFEICNYSLDSFAGNKVYVTQANTVQNSYSAVLHLQLILQVAVQPLMPGQLGCWSASQCWDLVPWCHPASHYTDFPIWMNFLRLNTVYCCDH